MRRELEDRSASLKEALNPQNQEYKPKGFEPQVAPVPFSQLFRFATTEDWVMMILGTIGAIAEGASMPFFSILFGNVADSFSPVNTNDEILDAAAQIAWKLGVVGLVTWIAGYVSFACWTVTGERQGIELRKRYFQSLLSQEIAFYDSINPNELSTKITEECVNVRQAVGDKVPNVFSCISMFITGLVIGYVRGWQLALVLTAFMPVIAVSGGIFVSGLQKMALINAQAYSRAGAVSEESLNAIRTVVSLGGQAKETSRYQTVLNNNKAEIIKYSVYAGIASGLFFMAMFGNYALGFFIGSVFIADGVTISGASYTGGTVLSVFFAVVMASFTPARATPSIKAFAVAKISAAKAYQIIDRISRISSESDKGMQLPRIEGNISFRNVSFAYPLKPDKTVLNGISFTIKRNEKTALVGESGCGKTTCMQLIERFYDIENGSITLDGYDLKSLNLKWMRENIGYVGQEPVLFATTIKENLLMAKDDATEEEIWEALRKANAYNFVQNLPDQLNTFVGNSGVQLSGGQKQRLAIARAILKNPSILLLDEATSALDRKNEIEIQRTLDQISEGRTTIVIAHRLTTIQNADRILVFDGGRVVEEGHHDELIARGGKYYALQHLQLQAQEEGNQDFNTQLNVKNQITSIGLNEDMITINQRGMRESMNKRGVNLEKLDIDNSRISLHLNEKSKNTQGKEPAVFGRLFKYNQGDFHLIFIGIFAAIINGMVLPFMAVLISAMLDVLSNPFDFNRGKADMISVYFLVLAVVAFVSQAIQISCFSVVAERLSRRIRLAVFQKYIRMPIGWFDRPENSPGALGSKLSTDATLINTLTSSVFGMNLQAVSSFLTGMVIAFTASWQLTLVGLGLSPILVISGKIRAKFNLTFMSATQDAYKDSVAFVSEAVNNMRTVASFGKEDKLLENYSKKLEGPLKAAIKNGHLSGLAFGFSQFVIFAVYAIVFYVGAIFITHIDLTFKNMFQSILGIMFAAMGAGNSLQFAPDVGAAKKAALNIFEVLDAVPEIDIDDPRQTVKKPIKGEIEFRNVHFKYPSRDSEIFKGLNLKINPSTKVALVGPSGCGKSTILALLQRFYDPTEGEILIDGINLKQYDLKYLRNCFGVVSQEPVLFNGTIEYNIKYSKEDATDEELREAAAQANALNFIQNNEFEAIGEDGLPDLKYGVGFQRLVGPKGSQLSGGQKQRIAIARAILKNPSVLILDEATSALDSQNERIVQESLDKIMEGKTCVIVAHRISTIRDADEIIVLNEGEIVERGNYHQLNGNQGIFYRLERGMNLS